DRVAIIDHGKVIALGTPAELITRVGGEHLIEFAVQNGDGLDERSLREVPGVRSVWREQALYCLAVAAPHIAIPEVLGGLPTEGRELERLTTRHASLEDVFVTLTGRHLREEGSNGQPSAQ